MNYYKHIAVVYEMAKFIKKREVAYIAAKHSKYDEKSMRMVNIPSTVRKVQYFQYSILDYKIQEYEINLYASVATYKKGIPYQDYKHMQQRKRVNQEWIAEHSKHVESYDLFIDIDSPNHTKACMKQAVLQTLMVHHTMNEYNMPHEIRFSGKGFHIISKDHGCDAHFDPYKENNVYEKFINFAQKLHDSGCRYVDMSIFDSRRVYKIPYSLAIYKNKSYVCTPILSILDLENFNIEQYTPENMVNKIKMRGFKVFNENKGCTYRW